MVESIKVSKNNTRIAILGTKGIPGAYGGFETFAEELSIRLVKRGLDVTVFCLGRDVHDEYQGVKLKYISVRQIGPFTTECYDFKSILTASKRFDVIFMLGYGGSLLYWLPLISGKTLWVNMDGLEWKRAKWPWYARLYLKLNEWLAVKWAALLIADSNGIRKYLNKKYGADIKCVTIPYGAEVIEGPPDHALIKKYSLQPTAYYLIVCRLEPENHVLEIIKGFLASSSPYPLIIVGDHSKRSSYVKKLIKLGSERIAFVGTLYEKNKLQALRYYSFAYFHGHSVGGTNPSLLEALGSGNIVIAHDNVFNREVAADTALYFRSSEEIPSILHTIESLSSCKRHEMKTASADRVRMFYAWDEIASRYERLLRETTMERR